MDDFDIYSDLPDFVWLKEEYGADVDVKKEELPTTEKDVIELKTKLLKLEKVYKLVLSHYSSLWKTAKQERKRMERQIADLRSQLDNLAFRRNRKTNHTIAPLPMPLNSYPATAFQPPINNFNYPPPVISQNFVQQQISQNLYSYPPPPIHANTTEQEQKQEEEISNEQFVDNLAVSSNVITPENSHGSDESEDEIVKKSEYRSTVYGERLRKKLLEEKRNAAKQKKELLLSEKKVNENKAGQQNTQDSENVPNNTDLKDKKVACKTLKTDLKIITENNNNEKPNETDAQMAQAPCEREELKNLDKIEIKDDTKNNEIHTLSKHDTARKMSEKDSLSKKGHANKERTDEELKNKKERDVNDRKQDDGLKIERERDLEREKQDESKIRRERELERRRKEEEIEKAKREQFEKRRREEEIERRRKEQEVERKRKEESDRRRREEVNRRRRDEEIEKRRKEEEIERRRREEIDKRRREEAEKRKREERRRKEEELERRKRDEIDKRRRGEEEAERRKKEEEQHAKKLMEIEKDRNEKQLKELIKERERIEQEMNTIKDEDTEEGEITESSNDTPCNGQSVDKKLQEHKEETKETSTDISKQSQKSLSDHRRKDDCRDGGRITRSNSSRVTNQMMHENRKKGYHEYANSKSDRHHDNHVNYDKHKHHDLRSRRDQLERDRERRKSLYRNKSRNRNRSNSGYRSDEDRGNRSPKRVRLQENDRCDRDKLKDTKEKRNSKIIGKSPKRRKQTRSDERSPQNNKRRKMSPSKEDLDCNIKSNKIDTRETSGEASNKLDDRQNIIDSALSNENTSSNVTKNLGNLKEKDSTKEEKEKLIEPLSKEQGEIVNKLANPQKENQAKDTNKNQLKATNPQTDEKGTNHANKMKHLMSELFEVREKPVGTLVDLKPVKNFEVISDETILTELEDGEVTDSDESMNSEKSPKVVQSHSTNEPTDTMNLSEKNKFGIVNSKYKLTAPLQTNNKKIVPKSNSEMKDSILYNMLTHNKHNINEESLKIKLHEKIGNKNEVVAFEDKSKSESCNKIVNKTDNTLSQIIREKQAFVNKTDHIESSMNKSSEIIETKDVKKNILSEVNENKTVSQPNDKINTITEKEKPTNGKKPNESKEIEKTDSENSAKSSVVPAISNVLIEQPHQNCLKANNLENTIDNKERLEVKRTEIHSETNNVKNTCLKENVNNDFIKKLIGPSVINEMLYKESSKPIVKSGNVSLDNASGKSVNISSTKVSLTTVKKIIVVRRRRRPVQLSDSPPVVVINNMK